MEYRVEHDSMGEVRVPADKYWGAQTERSPVSYTHLVGRRKDSSSCTSVLLPLPVPPMTAIFCPGRMCILTFCTAASDAPS